MNAATTASAAPGQARSARFHLMRGRKDAAARWLIGIGGVSVILAVVLIFFYLVAIVLPLFTPATVELQTLASRPDWANETPVYIAVEEQREVGARLSADGLLEFFHLDGSETFESFELLPDSESHIVRAVGSDEHNGLLAVATSDGRVLLLRISYETRFDGGVESRQIIPSLDYPFGPDPVMLAGSGEIQHLALSEAGDSLVLASVTRTGELTVIAADIQENLMTGERTLDARLLSRELEADVTALAISGNHAWLYMGDADGRVHRLGMETLETLQSVPLEGAGITRMTMLLGGISLLTGDENGVITQLFPVRNDRNDYSLQRVRQFSNGSAAIVDILSEQRRKGFLVLDKESELTLYHSTSERKIRSVSLSASDPVALALAPRANGLLVESRDGGLAELEINNEHPEVSFSSLWKKVWYENYQKPEFIWQSSASTNEFEPKFSLTPLVFGTLKAALYAMLFAIPLALMGAVYTAYFMAPGLRKLVKPGIEIMAALPTVILGFLAGLWFAPIVEQHLAGIIALFLVIPPGVLLFAWLWQRWDSSYKSWIPQGYEPLIQLPVLLILVMSALWLADPVQQFLLGTDLRTWLTQEAGIGYDQRNAFVVGCAMGVAVIPTIFSMAEDALYGVPRSLSDGSLALGATPWQTLIFVVVPTASPGIFSALMIGLGRAVGETMIVLMATGNTPIMDWNLFEGMRTLAANIAVEMPESEVNSSHYRILFLAALVLFLFTFMVNTIAEVVRQRLRERYSSL